MSVSSTPRPALDTKPIHLEPVLRSQLARVVTAIELDPDHVERFLGPLDDIVAAVRLGPAHAMFSITIGNAPIGFYVRHPDRRDGACWWLGWFALDRRRQGHGFGRASMARIMSAFRRLSACRRVRLLVSPDNAYARRLYNQAGFHQVDIAATGELILEATLTPATTASLLIAGKIRAVARAGNRSLPGRLRLLAGPYAARVIGVERGPPAVPQTARARWQQSLLCV